VSAFIPGFKTAVSADSYAIFWFKQDIPGEDTNFLFYLATLPEEEGIAKLALIVDARGLAYSTFRTVLDTLRAYRKSHIIRQARRGKQVK